MIKVFCFIFLFFWVSSSNAESLVKKFKKINNNNYNSNKIYDGKDFFFSLASLKVVNKNNTNILKRKVAIKALKQFKEFYIKKSKLFIQFQYLFSFTVNFIVDLSHT